MYDIFNSCNCLKGWSYLVNQFKYKLFYSVICLGLWILVIFFQPFYDYIRNKIVISYQTEYAYFIYLYEICIAISFSLYIFFQKKFDSKILIITKSVTFLILIGLVVINWWHGTWDILIFILSLHIAEIILQLLDIKKRRKEKIE